MHFVSILSAGSGPEETTNSRDVRSQINREINCSYQYCSLRRNIYWDDGCIIKDSQERGILRIIQVLLMEIFDSTNVINICLYCLRGMAPNLLKVVPAVSLSYIVYEKVKSMMGI